MSLVRTLIVCTETQEDFQLSFQEAVAKFEALGSGVHHETYALSEGKFVAFLSGYIPESQRDFDMSLSIEALKKLKEEMTKKDQERLAMYARQARGREETQRTRRIAPALDKVGLRTPTVLGRVWHRFSSAQIWKGVRLGF